MASAVILTIGNELVSGDVENTNGSWLARRLQSIGVEVRQIASLPDDVEGIAAFIREHAPSVTYLLATGGLGGTPDDLTREAVALAFGVEQMEDAAQAEQLRARFRGDPEYASRWARLPAGSRALDNPLGGAPGFAIENVYVLPGLPREMEAMFDELAPELAGAQPIGAWRRRYRTTESRIVAVLEDAGGRHPGVSVGSYPSFEPHSEVEVVLKSNDPEALQAATAWIEQALAEATES